MKASITALALTLVAAPAAAEVQTYFSPDELEVGQPARWVFESDDGRIALPDLSVEGLEVVGRSESQSMRIVNGAASTSHRVELTVVPTKEGELRIPSLKLRAGDGVVSTSPLRVEVKPNSGRRVPRAVAPRSWNPWRGRQQPRAPAPDPQEDAVGDAPEAFVKLIGPKRKLMLGEKTPIRIDAWFRGATSVTMKKPPSFDTDAFVIDELSAEPTERQEMKDGLPYTVLSWRGQVSAVKEGQHELRVEMPVHLQWRERNRRARRRAVDPFARMDALMDQMMSGRGLGAMDMFDDLFDGAGIATLGARRETDLTLRARRTRIEVVAPPEADRPEGYDGLVGRYEIEASVDRRSVRVGEPVTLSLRITGEALDRVPAVSVPDSDDWKAYRPQSRRQGDAVIIEQPLIAKRAGRLEIPPVSLPSYDPKTSSYVDAKSESIAIEVAEAEAMDGLVEASDDLPSGVRPEYSLLSRDRRFQWITGGLWSAGLLFVLFTAVRRLRTPGAEQRRDESEIAKLQKDARRAESPDAFATAALAYVRAVLAKRWSVEPEAITSFDLEQRCPRAERIKMLFLWEEASRYGAGGSPAPEPKTWWDDIENELADLETTR